VRGVRRIGNGVSPGLRPVVTPVRPPWGMTARLVVSLSGLAGSTLDAARDLTAELDARAVRPAHLVSPHGTQGTAAADWLADRGPAGDEVVLHGFRMPTGRRGRLGAHEAGLQLVAARAALHRLGLRAECFAPARWIASPGTLSTLSRNGFRVCAELGGVRGFDTGVLLSGRVLGIGGSLRAEPWRCLAVVMAAGRTARRGGLVRIAVDAADLGRPGIRQAVLDAVDIALHHGAAPTTHQELFEPRLPEQRRAGSAALTAAPVPRRSPADHSMTA
jgi:uncharacterized protein